MIRRAAGLLLLVACGSEADVIEPTSAPSDPRLEPLLVDCGPNAVRFYDRNTSDPVAVLTEKLERGDTEVLRRAKEELGRLGAESVPALARIVDRYFAEAMSSPHVRNALEALALNEAPEARASLLRGLDHPAEIVQLAALDGLLLNHVQPADFDLFEAHLRTPVGPSAKRKFAMGLVAADPERARALIVDWIAQGIGTGFYPELVPELAESGDLAELHPALDGTLPEHLAVYPLAAAARLGDVAARERLREALVGAELYVRTAAVQAAARAGLTDELLDLWAEEGDTPLRTVMLAHIASADTEPAKGEQVDAALLAGLDDPAPGIRSLALSAGLERNLPEAVNRTLANLEGDAGQLQSAFDALLHRFRGRPDDPLIDEVRTRLEETFRARVESAAVRSRQAPQGDRNSPGSAFRRVPATDRHRAPRGDPRGLAGPPVDDDSGRELGSRGTRLT